MMVHFRKRFSKEGLLKKHFASRGASKQRTAGTTARVRGYAVTSDSYV